MFFRDCDSADSMLRRCMGSMTGQLVVSVVLVGQAVELVLLVCWTFLVLLRTGDVDAGSGVGVLRRLPLMLVSGV